MTETVTLRSYVECREALRSRDLRQALYDEGRVVMDGVIVNLHGDDHVARRRLENRLFRRDTFAWYEAERIPRIVDEVLGAATVEGGPVDLLPLARRTMATLSIEVAGVDRPEGTETELARLHELMGAMAAAAIVAHATGDREAITERGRGALAAFDTEFYRPSLERRRTLVDRYHRGDVAAEDLPRDVLTTLLVNHDRLTLAPDVVLREVAYYPWVGTHSTANQFVHAMHHLLTWIADHPADREPLTTDAELRQRFVHESMRLHPASPVAVRRATVDVHLTTGTAIAAGTEVVISIEEANRDPAAVGPDPDRFDPARVTAPDVPPWGLSFGSGTHACLGQALAAGLAPGEADGAGSALVGAVTVMAGAMLARRVRPDPDDPPTLDPATTREVWGRYPVRIER